MAVTELADLDDLPPRRIVAGGAASRRCPDRGLRAGGGARRRDVDRGRAAVLVRPSSCRRRTWWRLPRTTRRPIPVQPRTPARARPAQATPRRRWTTRPPDGSTRRGPPALLLPPGIPVRAVLAYGSATLTLGAQQPGCRIAWNTLAGIGAVESAHGTHSGARLLDVRHERAGHPRAGAERQRGRHDPRQRQRRLGRRPLLGPCGRADAVHPRHLAPVGHRRQRGRRRRPQPDR